jgi:prenyltransferase beta subunit
MTYCALLALAVLRDDYALLDRAALKRMVGACQDADGGCVFAYSFLLSSACDEHWVIARAWAHSTSFVTMPGADDADLRMTYCAFVVCALLGDWSCIDLPHALSYIHRCRVRVPIVTLPLPSHPSLLLCMKSITDVRRRIRTNATGRIARWTDILRPRGITPRPW